MRVRTTLTSRESSEPRSKTPALLAPLPSMTLSCTETSACSPDARTPFSRTPRMCRRARRTSRAPSATSTPCTTRPRAVDGEVGDPHVTPARGHQRLGEDPGAGVSTVAAPAPISRVSAPSRTPASA